MVRNISLPMLNVLFFFEDNWLSVSLIFFIHLGCSLSLLFKIIFSSFFFFYDKCEHPHFLVQLKKKLSQSPIIEVVAAAQSFFSTTYKEISYATIRISFHVSFTMSLIYKRKRRESNQTRMYTFKSCSNKIIYNLYI
jgi:hypothetical protein